MYLQAFKSSSVKVVFAGLENAGKTSLINKLIGGSWENTTTPNLRSNLSYWPIQSSKGPVEALEIALKREQLIRATLDVSFEKTREKPLDEALWQNWGDVFVFVYAVDSLESYLETYSAIKKFLASGANRKLPVMGADDMDSRKLTMTLPVLWIGTKADCGTRAAPAVETVMATVKALPLKWAEVSSKNGDNITQVAEWIYEHWDVLKKREKQLYTDYMLHMSANISTKNVKGDVAITIDALGPCIRVGTLVKEKKLGFKQEQPCFLFEKALLLCKTSNKNSYALKKILPLNMMLICDSSKPPNEYAFEIHLFGRDNIPTGKLNTTLKDMMPPSSHVLNVMALTQADKDAWMDDLTFAIAHFNRDPERMQHAISIKTQSMAALRVQRASRRQVGLPWSLLSCNATSNVPIVIESITDYLNSAGTNLSGAFLFSGDKSEMRTLCERVNRLDPDGARPSHASSAIAVSSGSTSGQSGASSPTLVSSTNAATIVGQSVASAAGDHERRIDLSGISPMTAAEFLLAFIHAAPSFVPVGFFSLLLASIKDLDINTGTGNTNIRNSFTSLPATIFNTLARLFFIIQQAIVVSADDSIVLKVSKIILPLLVKDPVEFNALPAARLHEVTQKLIREADILFAVPTDASPSPQPGKTMPEPSTPPAPVSTAPTFANSPSSLSVLSSLSFGPLSGSSSSLPNVGSLLAESELSPPTPSVTLSSLHQLKHTKSQSSISQILRMTEEPASTGGVANRSMKRSGSFGAIVRVLASTSVDGLGVYNTEQVMSRISRGRSIIAELLDGLKSVESAVQAPEIENVLQSLVISCNNLSRHKWEKFQEIVEIDLPSEFVYLAEVVWRTMKGKSHTVEKSVKSKNTKTILVSLLNDMTQAMNQFTIYISLLKGFDQVKPAGETRPYKPRAGAALASSGSSLGSVDSDGSDHQHGASTGGSDGSALDDAAANMDLMTVSAKDWWAVHFGQHSLRCPTERLVTELLAVSKSAIPTTSSEDAGSQPGSPREGASTLIPLTISDQERKILAQIFDHQNTGFVNLLKFSQFLKAFGSIALCVESALTVARLPCFLGYLSNFETVRLLEPEPPGTYLLCFHSNDPSNWYLHWADSSHRNWAMQIDCAPGEYTAKPRKIVELATSATLGSTKTNYHSHSPSLEVPSTALTNDKSPRDASTPSESASGSAKLHTMDTGSSHSADAADGSATSPDSAKGVLVENLDNHKEEQETHHSVPSLIAAHSAELKRPLKTTLYSLPYFYGDISESEGMRALKNQAVGTYLVVFSATQPLVLDCLYVTIEERVGHILFHIIPTSSRSSLDASVALAHSGSSLDDSGGIGTSDSGSALSPTFDIFSLNGSRTDGIRVRVESGENFSNISDAINFYPMELKTPLTTKRSSGHVGMGSVHEGSLEKLVAYLYDDVVDLAYITAFLLTYRSFTQPPTLLDALISHYRHLETVPNGKPYQMRLVNFFKIWLSDFSWDLVSAQGTLAKMKTFIESDLTQKFPSIAKLLVNYVAKVPSEKTDVAQPPLPSPVPNAHSYEELSYVLEYSPEVLAQQLFFYEFEGFSRIQPFELMGNGWMKPDKHTRAPNIVRMVARSNLLGSWVVSEILKEGVLKKRAALIEHFISVTDESYKLNNFHSTMVVMSALHDSSVQRLKLTWEKVGKKAKETLEGIELKMADEDNFGLYRAAYAQAPPPKLPYMGLVFRDLVHIEDGSPKLMPNGAINFHRCELIAEKLHMIKLSQQDRLSWPKNEDLWLYISTFPKHPDPNSQYQRSLELEPRAGGLNQSSATLNTGGTSDRAERRGSRVMVFSASQLTAANNQSASSDSSSSTSTGGFSDDSVIRPVSPGPSSSAPNITSPLSTSPNNAPGSEGRWAVRKATPKPNKTGAGIGFMRASPGASPSKQ